jgi:hypothetical protein
MGKMFLGFGGSFGISGGGGGGNVTTSGLSAKQIPVATSANNIEDSPMFYDGGNGFGMSLPGASATGTILEINATDGGFLVPRLTKVQREAIATPANGLQVFQTDATPGFFYYDGATATWTRLGGGITTSGLTATIFPIATAANNIENGSLSVAANVLKNGYVKGFATNHLVGLTAGGGPPTIATVAGQTTAATISGTDMAGTIDITFDAAVTPNTVVANVTFGEVYSSVPGMIMIQQISTPIVGTINSQPTVLPANRFTTNFEIRTRGAVTGLAFSTMQLVYIVIQ